MAVPQAHSADSVRSSLPILMRYCEGLSSGPQQGPLGVRCSQFRRWRDQKEVWGNRMTWLKCVTPRTRMADGKKKFSGRRENDFKVTYRKLYHIQEPFPVTPYSPWCQPFVCRKILLWTMQVTYMRRFENIRLTHRIFCGNTPCIIHRDAFSEAFCWCWGKTVTVGTSFVRFHDSLIQYVCQT